MSEDPAPPRTFGRTLFEVLFTIRTTIAALSVILLVAISALPNLGVIAGWVFIPVHGFSNVVGITLIYTSGDRVLNALLFG